MIRLAEVSDVDAIMTIVGQAQQALAELGIDQWQDGYPSRQAILDDIACNVGYVAVEDNRVIGYAAIVLTGEEAYKQIDANEWNTSNDYVVVHRLCVSSSVRRSGIAIRLMHHAAMLARERSFSAFRIDTHRGNIRMLAMLQKLGFKPTGIIHYDSGERVAYDLDLSSSNIL
ncbi:MAG: GNAT family N-acetyltransferase [Alistipes sp.]|nr:GNAT family N-acetyltransferase [Alistipes sp.]